MTYRRAINRNGLSKADGFQGRRDPLLIAADFERVVADQTDEAHLHAYARRVHITPAQVRELLETLFWGDVEENATDELRGIHVREVFLARSAECSCEGSCSVLGAGLDRIVVKRLPHQPESLCLVALIAVTAEVEARRPAFGCVLIDPLDHDALREGLSSVEMVIHPEPPRDDNLARYMVIARMGAPIFEEAGEYTAALTVDGYEIARVPFTVALRKTIGQHLTISQ